MSLQRLVPLLLLVSVVLLSCSNDDGPVVPSTQGSIAGRVIDRDGQPVIGAAVGTTPATQAKVTGADGSFTLTGLNAGTYVVLAAKADVGAGSATVTVEAGRSAAIDIVLGGGGPVNQAPTTPHTPTPAMSATDQPLDLTLRWVSTDADGDPLRFDIYFGTSSAPEKIAADHSAPSFPRSGLLPGTQYFWRIVVRDNHGGEASSPVWSFTTANRDVIRTGLVAFYPFDASALDASGNALHGQLRGDAGFESDRKGNPRAALSVGGRGFVEVAHSALLDFGSSTDFTATAWIRTRSSQVEFAGIASKMVGGIESPFSGWQIFLTGSSFGAQVETVESRNDVFSQTYLSDDRWHQVALVVRRAIGNIRLYVDGVLVRDYTSPTVYANLSTTAPLFMGKDRTSNRFFVGLIDDVRIYNRALPASELDALRD